MARRARRCRCRGGITRPYRGIFFDKHHLGLQARLCDVQWVCQHASLIRTTHVPTSQPNRSYSTQLHLCIRLISLTRAPAAAPDVKYANTLSSPDGLRIFLKVSFEDTIIILQGKPATRVSGAHCDGDRLQTGASAQTCTAGS